MKKYIVSSTSFNTKFKMLQQLADWEAQGTLDNSLLIYEIDDKIPTYKLQRKIDLVKVKSSKK